MRKKLETYLLSTVVAPEFTDGNLCLKKIDQSELIERLKNIQPGHNLCGHPVTSDLLKGIVPGLPDPVRDFWKGNGIGIAIRPRTGVRGAASSGDTALSGLSDLEWVTVTFKPTN